MRRKSVIEKVEESLIPFLKNHGIELYDIEFVKEDGERYLRVFVDKHPTISIDDCERVSKYLSNQLDKSDPIKEHYYLEVSSPGAERIFKKESDYEKYLNHKVEVHLIRPLDGLNLYLGRLLKKDEHELVLELRPKKNISIPVELIDYVKNILEI